MRKQAGCQPGTECRSLRRGFVDAGPTAVKIFLSYGHDRNAPLVERISRDLQAAGHTVWIDTSEIKAGDDWRRRIVDGLVDSDWTLGFLSRHSTRDPGVCLDELAIALHVKAGTIATVLVEAEAEVEPPVSVSHIQWLDMHDWAARAAQGSAVWDGWYKARFAEILALLADPANQRFAGEIGELELRLQPISQVADIGVLVDGFIGREWLRTRLEQWRQHERDSRLFWVSGSAGVGKSAFAAWLAHHGKVNVIALNLCRYNVDERRDPARVLRTLAFQVATRLPDYRRLLLDRLVKQDRDGTEILRKSPAALFDWLVAEPMHLSIDGGRRAHRFLVVIDALDETIRDRRSELAEVLADSAPKLPPWIAIVVTSRPEPAILRQFAALKPQTIDAEADENLNDLRTYAHGWLAAQHRPPGEIGALVERIVAASGGNFLYLRKLREAADAGLWTWPCPRTCRRVSSASTTGGLGASSRPRPTTRFTCRCWRFWLRPSTRSRNPGLRVCSAGRRASRRGCWKAWAVCSSGERRAWRRSTRVCATG